jgi:hypothetical protein
MILMWMGKNVDDMSRDEAVAALKGCMNILRNTQAANEEAWRFMELLRNRKRQA